MTANKTEQSGPQTAIWYDVKPGWEQWLFFTSDNHFDSIYCNREKMQEDFDEAKHRRARIFIAPEPVDVLLCTKSVWL